MIIWRFRPKQVANAVAALAALLLTGCASLRTTSSNHLARSIAQADAAYETLKADQVSSYNNAVASIVRTIDGETPEQLRSSLDSFGVKFDQPKIPLPLARCHVAPRSAMPNESRSIGVSMLLDYDTSNAPLYPRDGLITSATAVYRRVGGRPHFCLLTAKSIELNGSIYPLNVDNVSPITDMERRGRHVARAGFHNMLQPGTMPNGPEIYLTEPYDPNKAVLLIVPGLQSTPFAFVDLMKAIRSDAEVREHVQVWTFLYATGTPVLFNALELRQQLGNTIAMLDPHDHDFATRHIIVLGHSMGGLMAHTLVSSSGEKLWKALFVVSPHRLKGDKTTIHRLLDGLHFHRNSRVIAVIFAATPHRGSNLAESWIGRFAASLIQVPRDLQSDFIKVTSENPNAATPAAKMFHHEMNFSSVHTLSPHDPALQALADLPIEMPFHSVLGQRSPGPIETGNDGVVSYSSAHLDRAASELVVHSGHGVCENREAQREVLRILRLELEKQSRLARQ